MIFRAYRNVEETGAGKGPGPVRESFSYLLLLLRASPVRVRYLSALVVAECDATPPSTIPSEYRIQYGFSPVVVW